MKNTQEYFNKSIDELLIENGAGYTIEEDLLFDSGSEVIFLDDEKEFQVELDGIKSHMKEHGYDSMETVKTINERIAVILN